MHCCNDPRVLSSPTASLPLMLSHSLSMELEDDYNYSDLELEAEEEEDELEDEDQDLNSDKGGTHTAHSHSSPRRKSPKPQVATVDDYRVIDETELFAQQRELVRDLAQVLELAPAVATALLRHFGWNKERLFEEYCLDPEATRKAAGLECVDIPPPVFGPTEEIDCFICCDSYPSTEVFAMGCGHVYCKTCWRSYLAAKISEGPLCVGTTCIAVGCKEAVLETSFRALLPDDEFARYARFLLRSYVDINKCIRWCPAAGCNKAISSTGGLAAVTCSCGTDFCFRCGEEDHAPISCEQLRLWQEKCQDESETVNWMVAHTKMCPNCKVRIEKNHGCNHMTCRKCTYEFCWICMGKWNGHYSCNRYDEELNAEAKKAQNELSRYLHYFQRYANHAEAGKFAEKMRAATEERMNALQGSLNHPSLINAQFLANATELLLVCRRVLKYTFAYAFYLSPGKEKDLFEYLQEDLEKNTEHLTELSEKPLDEISETEVVNYTRVTERFLKNLLTGVEDGLTATAPCSPVP